MIRAANSSLIIPWSTMTSLDDDGMVMRVYRPKIALERNLPMLLDDDDSGRSSVILVEEAERSTMTIFATRTWKSSCTMPNRM